MNFEIKSGQTIHSMNAVVPIYTILFIMSSFKTYVLYFADAFACGCDMVKYIMIFIIDTWLHISEKGSSII